MYTATERNAVAQDLPMKRYIDNDRHPYNATTHDLRKKTIFLIDILVGGTVTDFCAA